MELIHGVVVKKLKTIADERGRLMEMLRNDDPMFIKFGQLYLTAVYSGVVKAWHYHRKQTDHFVCVKGMAKVVLYDNRDDSPTRNEINEFFIGEHNQQLIQIPPLVYHGFKSVGDGEAIIINCPTEVYDYTNPDEYRIPAHDENIPYDWSRRDG